MKRTVIHARRGLSRASAPCAISLALCLAACGAAHTSDPSDGDPDGGAATDGGAVDLDAAVIGASCVEMTPSVFESPASEGERVFNAVLETHLEQLDRWVGRYARGDVPLYSGSVSASDTGGALWFWGGDGALDDTGVLATVLPENVLSILRSDDRYARGPARVLRIVSTAERKTLAFYQTDDAPGFTWSTPIVAHESPWPRWSAPPVECVDCAPDLWAPGDTLTLDRFRAERRYHVHVDNNLRHESLEVHDWADLEVLVSAELTRVPAGEITFSQIVDVSAPNADVLEEFRLVDGTWVRAIEATLSESAPLPEGRALDPPDPEWWRCTRTTDYEAEQYVDAACLGRYGLRDVRVVGTPETCCEPVCSDCMGFCF